MPDPRHKAHVPTPPRPNIGVPDAQTRALDRRHSLDEQQRTFRAPSGPLRKGPRPPS